MEVEQVGDLAIQIILSKLSSRDLAVVCCVSPRFRVWASDNSLWSYFCFHDLQLSSPIDPFGNTSPSFKEAYHTWRVSFSSYPWDLVKRVKQCWDTLRNWLEANFPEAASTLQKGASEDEIKEFENSLKVILPIPTRLLYRFCNGQRFPDNWYTLNSLGIIGGYSFYDHDVNVFLLPLSQVKQVTQQFKRYLNFNSKPQYIVVAASSTHVDKLFFLNCLNGQLYVGTDNLREFEEMLPCVPSTLISMEQKSNNLPQQDAMLLWLEEHGRRLQNGVIRLCGEYKSRSISLFPELPPDCSTALTHGVQVLASAVFVPEITDLQNEFNTYLFAYSIRMCVPERCNINGMIFDSCQLSSRHWAIRSNGDAVSDVHGEGVIGEFPILQPGDQEFIYESCSHLKSSHGSMEGFFTFIPGRIQRPEGGSFDVKVAPFLLQVPDYIF